MRELFFPSGDPLADTGGFLRFSGRIEVVLVIPGLDQYDYVTRFFQAGEPR